MDRNSTDARRLVRSIRKWYNKATAREREQGASWYDTARADCRQLAAEFSTSPARAAAIVAVLSPMVRWERTLADARRVLRAALQPTPDTPASAPMGLGTTAFPANVRKAWDLALLDVAPLDVVRGPKVTAFYQLLAGFELETAVVVDSVAIMAAVGIDPTPFTTSEDAKQYFNRPNTLRAIREAYRSVAASIGVAPHAVQATVWLVWRGERDKV